jgi:hypothetical protein
MRQFKRMQELLGTWHDLVVLADRALLAVAESELAHHDAAGAERVIDLAKHAVRRSVQELSAFVKLWQQQGAKLTARIRSAFPLTKAVAVPEPVDVKGDEPHGTDDAAGADVADEITGSQTDPGPSGSATQEVPEADA